MGFYERLSALMDERGLKQVDFCKLTGLSSAQVNHLVNGRTKDPKLSTAIKVADALGVSLDYLAGRASPPGARAYADARQRRMNEAYEQMDEEGRELASASVTAMRDAKRARVEESAPAGLSEAM